MWVEWANTIGVPLPDTLYTRPLARYLETTTLVNSQVMTEQGSSLRFWVKELLMERLTDHTCEKGSTRSWISENYPQYTFEPGLEDKDILWRADQQGMNEEHVARKQRLLEDIFENDDSLFIPLTTHSYAISAILEAVGAPHFRVSEGAIIPVFVKAEKVLTWDSS
ncbi:Fc.00g033290.m01.CDS01 [Cosmosporella sp. VM-42]